MNCEFCFSFFSPFLFFSFLFPFTSFLREPRASRERAPEEKKRQGEGTSQKKSFRIIYKCMTEEEFKAKKKIERKKERKKHDTKRTSSIVSHWNCNHHVLLLSFSFSVSLYYYVGGGGGGEGRRRGGGFPPLLALKCASRSWQRNRGLEKSRKWSAVAEDVWSHSEIGKQRDGEREVSAENEERAGSCSGQRQWRRRHSETMNEPTNPIKFR